MNVNLNPIIWAFAGGLLIGLASTIHFLLKGRVTGMSGTFFGLITADSAFSWKSCLLSGLLFTSCLAYRIFGFNEVSKNTYLFDPPQAFNTGIDNALLVIAGLFVGIGTKLANGCTSGHGVCGLPRFSSRSLVAVLTFMAIAILTANLKSELMKGHQLNIETTYNPDFYVNCAMIASLLIPMANFVTNKKGFQGITDIAVSFLVGAIFSLGLLVSGMSRKSKVLGFLTLTKNWDMSLMFVMGGAVLLNIITFNYIIHMKKKPILADKLSIPSSTKIDAKLIGGAALFGLGWGLAGICPGPAMIVTPVYFSSMIKFIGSMAAGQYLASFIESKVIKQKAE